MKWTKTKPEKSGHYWYKKHKDDNPYVIRIWKFKQYNGYFSTKPIPEPKGYEDE